MLAFVFISILDIEVLAQENEQQTERAVCNKVTVFGAGPGIQELVLEALSGSKTKLILSEKNSRTWEGEKKGNYIIINHNGDKYRTRLAKLSFQNKNDCFCTNICQLLSQPNYVGSPQFKNLKKTDIDNCACNKK
jgi:hypothetical protein